MGNLPTFGVASTTLTKMQKVGQLFMPAAFINDKEEEIQQLEKLIATFHIGSICFFHSRASAATNFEGKKEVVYNEESYQRLRYLIERYQNAAQYPLLIAIDAEWGLAMRIENTPQYPYAITLGAMQEKEGLIYQVGQHIAKDCLEAGIHWNLSPVVDVNLNPENPVIGYRSFGDKSEAVTQCAQAYLEGMASEGVLNAIKHFPGHGDTAIDSHLGLPVISKTKMELSENEIYPFTQLLNTHTDAIMVGHLAVPALSSQQKISASLSKEIMIDFLRDELGWNGLIISDALNMKAIAKNFTDEGALEHHAFEAGNDVLCFANAIAEGITTIADKSSVERIDASFKRLWDLKTKVFKPQPRKGAPVIRDYHKLMEQLAAESITLAKGTIAKIAQLNKTGYQFFQFGAADGYFREVLLPLATHSDAVLLSLVPRQVKPNNNFGFSDEELGAINKILHLGKTVLYLFGNPFLLRLLDWERAQAAVVVYQNFKSFQKKAVLHFQGKVEAKGKLPVKL